MRRREFLTLATGTVASWPRAVLAQKQPVMPLVGVMSPLSIGTAARNLAALRNGLRDLGYVDGQNIRIKYRFGDGNPERFASLLSELVGLKPSVIVVGSNAAIMAATKATQTIPLIGFMASATSTATGKVASFAHPGANVDRFSNRR
jgi:putative tryptophan/tyrosine transport system substrate-binding protein